MYKLADVKIARALSKLTIPDILKVFGLNEVQPDSFYDDVTEYLDALQNYPDMFAIGTNVFHPHLAALVMSQLKMDTSFTNQQRKQLNQLEVQLVDSINSKYQKLPVFNTTKFSKNSNEPLYLEGGGNENNVEERNLSDGLKFGPPILNNITKLHEVPFKDVVRYKGSKPENLRNYIFRKITEIRELIETQMRIPKGRRQLKTKLNFLFDVDRKLEALLTNLEIAKSFTVAEAQEFKSDLATLDATLTDLQNTDERFSNITEAFFTVEESGENVEKESSQQIYSMGLQILRNNMEASRVLIAEHISTLMSQFDDLNEPIIIIIDHIKHIFTEERNWWLIKLGGGLITEQIGFDNFDELYIDPNGGKGLDKEMYYTNVNSKLLLWNSITSKEQITADKAGDYRKGLRAAIACTTALTIGTVMYYTDMFSTFGATAAASLPMLTILAQQTLSTGERVAGKFFDATARLPQGTQERLAGAVVDLVDGKASLRSVAGTVVQTYAATLKQISDSLPSTILRKVRLQIAGQKSMELIKYEQAVRTIRLDPSQYIRGRKEISTTIAALKSEITTLEAQMAAATSPEFRAAKGAEITAKSVYLQQISSAIPCDTERIDPYWSITAWTSSTSNMNADERARIEECIKAAIQRTALANFQTNLMTYAEIQSRLFDEADLLLKSNARGLARLAENTEKRSPEQLKAHIRNIVKNSVRELEAGLGVRVAPAASRNASTPEPSRQRASETSNTAANEAARRAANNAAAANSLAAARAEAAAAEAASRRAAENASRAQSAAETAAANARRYNRGPAPGSGPNPTEENAARSAVPLTAAQARVAAREAESARGRAAAAALRVQAAEAHGKFARPTATARGGSRKSRDRKLNTTRKTGGAWTLGTGLTDAFMGTLRGLAVLTKAGVEIDKERVAEAEILASNAVVVAAEGRAFMAARDREQLKYVTDSRNVVKRTIGLGLATIGTIAGVAYSGGAASLGAAAAAAASGASPEAAKAAGAAAGAAARTVALKAVATASDAAAMVGLAPSITKFVSSAANGAAVSKAETVLDAVNEFVEGGADVREVIRIVREEGVFGSKLKTLVNAAPAAASDRVSRPVIKRRGLLERALNEAGAGEVPQQRFAAPTKVAVTTKVPAPVARANELPPRRLNPPAPELPPRRPNPAPAPRTVNVVAPAPRAANAVAPAPRAANAAGPGPLNGWLSEKSTTISAIKQKIIDLELDITEDQLKSVKTKALLIDLFKAELAKKGLPKTNVPKPNAAQANAGPVNAAPKANAAQANAGPVNAAPKANAAPANAAPKANVAPANLAPKANAAPANATPSNAAPANAAPKPNGNVVGNIFNPETTDAAILIRELYRLSNADEKKEKEKKQREIARCRSGAGKADCLRKIYYNWIAQEAKAEHQGDPEDEGKKEKAIAAAAKIGMSEDEAEDWLQEPPEGGKRKTRKNSRRRSKITRRH